MKTTATKRGDLLYATEALALLNRLRARDGLPPVKGLDHYKQKGRLAVSEKKSGRNFYRAGDVIDLHEKHIASIAERGTQVGRPRKTQKKSREQGS